MEVYLFQSMWALCFVEVFGIFNLEFAFMFAVIKLYLVELFLEVNSGDHFSQTYPVYVYFIAISKSLAQPLRLIKFLFSCLVVYHYYPFK